MKKHAHARIQAFTKEKLRKTHVNKSTRKEEVLLLSSFFMSKVIWGQSVRV